MGRGQFIACIVGAQFTVSPLDDSSVILTERYDVPYNYQKSLMFHKEAAARGVDP